MRQRIDLGAETIAFVRQCVAEIVGEKQENIQTVKFDMKEGANLLPLL